MLLDNVVFLDLETTGGSPQFDRIIEIGLVHVKDGAVLEEWSTLVNPGRHVPAGIHTLTGISSEMLAAAPSFSDIAPALAARLAGYTLAAHNARFDYGFLRHEFTRAGETYRAPVLCTVKLSRKLYPQHPRHNLDALLVRHAIFCLDRHRALGDARVLWELGAIWRREFGDAHVDSICGALVAPVTAPAALPPGTLDEIPEAPGTYVFYGDDDAALYVGRSANMRARVIAHFARADRGKDAAIARDVRRIEWHETTGELGAALREIALISALAPTYNRPRDTAAGLFSWRWSSERPLEPPALVPADAVTDDMLAELYGVFRTRAAAKQALRALTPAFEPTLQHAMRLAAALSPLRVKRWPYAGCIGVREHDPSLGRSEVHVLDRWCYFGTARSDADLAELLESPRARVFSLESYKVLERFLKSPPIRCRIFPLTRALVAAA